MFQKRPVLKYLEKLRLEKEIEKARDALNQHPRSDGDQELLKKAVDDAKKKYMDFASKNDVQINKLSSGLREIYGTGYTKMLPDYTPYHKIDANEMHKALKAATKEKSSYSDEFEDGMTNLFTDLLLPKDLLWVKREYNRRYYAILKAEASQDSHWELGKAKGEMQEFKWQHAKELEKLFEIINKFGAKMADHKEKQRYKEIGDEAHKQFMKVVHQRHADQAPGGHLKPHMTKAAVSRQIARVMYVLYFSVVFE